VLRNVVQSAGNYATPATLAFAQDALARRRIAYEELLLERMLWLDRFVASSANGRDEAEYARRLHGENIARQLLEVIDDCRAILAEWVVQ